MSFRVMRLIREAPVTLLCVAVCALLFFATTLPQGKDTGRKELLHRWGAVVDLPYVRIANDRPDDVELILHGPLALWQGQWWRIPISAFHHVDFWHLFMNSVSAMYLGRLLEPRWGSWRMLLFLPGATIIPLIPEFLAGTYVVGFSGVICAMFGALCVLRYVDESLQEEFPDEFVLLGGALLAFGVILSILDLAPIANLAHMTGFFWGALAGCATTGFPWGVVRPRLVQYLVGAAMVPGIWLAMHPVWNGTYLWFATLEKKPGDEERLAGLRLALDRDPQLVGACRQLADEYFRRGETMSGWETLLQGLSHNPSNAELLQEARRTWRIVVFKPGRTAARKVIDDVFGDMAAAWEDRFRDDPGGWMPDAAAQPSSVVEIEPTVLYPLNQALDLRLPDSEENEGNDTTRWRIPPEGDAVEGRLL